MKSFVKILKFLKSQGSEYASVYVQTLIREREKKYHEGKVDYAHIFSPVLSVECDLAKLNVVVSFLNKTKKFINSIYIQSKRKPKITGKK